MFQNSKIPKFQNHLASFACITVSGFIFLRDGSCSLQTNRREFLLCYSYISESLIGWVFNHLKSLIDRVFPRNCSVGGGGGGGRDRIGELGRGECWSEKKISRFEISRGWHLCVLIILQTNPVIRDYYFILNVSKFKCINSKNTRFLKSDGHFTQRKMRQMFSCLKMLFQLSKCK